MCIIHYSSAGDVIWSNSFGGLSVDVFTDVAFGNSGTLLVCGSYMSNNIIIDGNNELQSNDP